MRPFMPRDNDKNNDSHGRRDRPPGGKGRSGAARGPEKKFAKRGFAGKGEGERAPYAGKREGARSFDKKPYSKPYAGNREDRPPRRDYGDAPRPRSDRPFADRPSRGGDGEKRAFRPREDRGGDKPPSTPRGDRPFGGRPPRDGDRPRGDRPFADRPERKFGGDKKFSGGDRGPRKDFGSRPDRGKDFGRDRGDSKPWQKRDASSPDHAGRNS